MNAMLREREILAEEIQNMELQAGSWRRRIGAAWDYVRLVERGRWEDPMAIRWHIGEEKAKFERWPIQRRGLKKRALAKERERINDAIEVGNGSLREIKRNQNSRLRKEIGETFDNWSLRKTSRETNRHPALIALSFGLELQDKHFICLRFSQVYTLTISCHRTLSSYVCLLYSVQ
jgi:hypothetical protein